jgi:hypothetical protein
MKLFSGLRGFIGRPTHDRPAALRQAGRTFPERGNQGGETTWLAPYFFRHYFVIPVNRLGKLGPLRPCFGDFFLALTFNLDLLEGQ